MVWSPTTTPEDVIIHSAKGSTWKNHKYIKKIGDAYIYAKRANKHQKLANEYAEKQQNAYKRAGIATASGVRTRMGNPSYNYVTGKDNEDELKYAYKQGEMATRYRDASWSHGNLSRRYSNLSKKILKSIPKEMISDGKKLFDSLTSKLKKKSKNIQTKKIQTNEIQTNEIQIKPITVNKATVKGSKVTTWDNAKVKRW